MFSEDYGLFEDLISPHSWKPPADVCETDTAYILKLEIPGVEEGDIQLRVQEKHLEISGLRQFGGVPGEDDYHQLESFRGRFRRVFTFPAEVDRGEVTAELENGILTVHLAKSGPKKRRVEVRE
jgi:HSP20 family protein